MKPAALKGKERFVIRFPYSIVPGSASSSRSHPQGNRFVPKMAPQGDIPLAANVLGTIGTVFWCVQLGTSPRIHAPSHSPLVSRVDLNPSASTCAQLPHEVDRGSPSRHDVFVVSECCSIRRLCDSTAVQYPIDRAAAMFRYALWY